MLNKENYHGKILARQFHIQVEIAVMFFEYRPLLFLVVAQAGYKRNVPCVCSVAFQFHRRAEQQRNQWANASDVWQQSGLTNGQTPGRRISCIDRRRNNILTRRILKLQKKKHQTMEYSGKWLKSV